MDSMLTDYEKNLTRLKTKLIKHSGVLYVISDRLTRRLVHITANLGVARAMQDQKLGALRMHMHALADLPQHYDHDQPWLAICPRSYQLEMAKTPAADAAAYQLLGQKCWALELLLEKIHKFHVHALQAHLPHQQRIYDSKAAQARMVLTGCTDFDQTYHVHDWSEISGQDLEQAARDILFKHEEADIVLNQIESIRLRYQHRILAADNHSQLPHILNEFKHESESNGKI
jgi:hypothetical protein